jgi:hypothetical protein
VADRLRFRRFPDGAALPQVALGPRACACRSRPWGLPDATPVSDSPPRLVQTSAGRPGEPSQPSSAAGLLCRLDGEFDSRLGVKLLGLKSLKADQPREEPAAERAGERGREGWYSLVVRGRVRVLLDCRDGGGRAFDECRKQTLEPVCRRACGKHHARSCINWSILTRAHVPRHMLRRW